MTREAQHTSDQIWVEAIKSGNQTTWTEFFDSIKGKLLHFTKGLLVDKSEAESIVSAAFTVLWKLKENQGTRTDMEMLLFSVCRRKAYDSNAFRYKGGKARSLEILSENMDQLISETLVDDKAMNGIYEAQLVDQLYEAIDQLSGRSRDVMNLILQGKSLVEIGRILDMSAANVRVTKKRAMEKLLYMLSEKEMLTLAMLLTIRQLIDY